MNNFNAYQWKQMEAALDDESLLSYGSYQTLVATNPVNGVSIPFAEILANEDLNRFAVYCLDAITNRTVPYLIAPENGSTLTAMTLLNWSLIDMHFRLNHVPGCDTVVISPLGLSTMLTGTSKPISGILDNLEELVNYDEVVEPKRAE
jgi:hypothetical protein